MQSFLNWILFLIKWPMAFLMVILLLPAVLSLIGIIHVFIESPMVILFLIPLCSVCLLWMLFLRGKGTSFLAIFEHEITHMFIALITFNKPVSLTVHHNKGGQFEYQGKGNWLISLAPYFFPTFPLIIMLGSSLYSFMNQPIPGGLFVVLGLATGYHICTTIASIHPKQTDFKQAGFLFTLLFLPAANVICYGLILSFVAQGWSGFRFFLNLLAQTSVLMFDNKIPLF